MGCSYLFSGHWCLTHGFLCFPPNIKAWAQLPEIWLEENKSRPTNSADISSGDAITGVGSMANVACCSGRRWHLGQKLLKRKEGVETQRGIAERKRERSKKIVENLPGKQWAQIFHWFSCTLIIAGRRVQHVCTPSYPVCWCIYAFAWSYLTKGIDLWLRTAVGGGLLWAAMKTSPMKCWWKNPSHPILLVLIWGTPCWYPSDLFPVGKWGTWGW